jgi:hypothetical protein
MAGNTARPGGQPIDYMVEIQPEQAQNNRVDGSLILGLIFE